MSRELCIMACVFCRDPVFQEWAGDQTGASRALTAAMSRAGRSEALAKAFILDSCQIDSRNELDTDPDAAARFHDLVRKPFLEWRENHAL